MIRRCFLALLLHASIGWPASSLSAAPNILLITADDLGFQLGCYGDTVATTPHLDALAAGGVQFMRGYVTQASCSPSRASLLSGLHPHQHGQIGLANYPRYTMRTPLPPLLPDVMKQAGYTTACFGKIQVRPENAVKFDFAETDSAATCRPGVAAAFLKKVMPADGPFFLYCNLFDPHAHGGTANFPRDIEGSPKVKVHAAQVQPFPFIPPPHRDAKPLRQQIANYYCAVNRLDERVGELLATLRESGRERDTLVIFLSDNGPPFWRGKCNPTEGGLRVPFLIRWPAQIKAARRNEALVSSLDVLPTLCAAAGIAAPPDLPGKSLLPLLRGEVERVRDTLATEFTSHTPDYFQPCRSLRDERYKVTINLLKQPGFAWPAGLGLADFRKTQARADRYAAVELYDLETDPWENRDLAADPALQTVREKLLRQLHEWREQTRDPTLDSATLARLILQHAHKP